MKRLLPCLAAVAFAIGGAAVGVGVTLAATEREDPEMIPPALFGPGSVEAAHQACYEFPAPEECITSVEAIAHQRGLSRGDNFPVPVALLR